EDLRGRPEAEDYLNDLNRELLDRLQAGGEAYASNAVVNGRFLLRACIVNFRTRLADVEALPEIVARLGREIDSSKRPSPLRPGGESDDAKGQGARTPEE
ncbi:MAG TPA: hypothetical protein VGL03_01985, partial [Thermoanaerobaculia bacterium]